MDPFIIAFRVILTNIWLHHVFWCSSYLVPLIFFMFYILFFFWTWIDFFTSLIITKMCSDLSITPEYFFISLQIRMTSYILSKTNKKRNNRFDITFRTNHCILTIVAPYTSLTDLSWHDLSFVLSSKRRQKARIRSSAPVLTLKKSP